MKRNIYTIVVFIVLFVKLVALSQGNNPFEIKSRTSAKPNIQNDKNVFDLDAKTVDTLGGDRTIQNEFNPFELNNNHLKKKHIKPQSNNPGKKETVKQKSFSGSSDFLLWIFLFVLAFIAILLSINRNLISKIIKVIWYYNHTNSLLRNFNRREFLFYIFLYIVFIFSLSIFVYNYVKLHHGFSGLDFFLRVFGTIAIIYIVKHIFILLFNMVFPSLKGLVLYNFTVFLFNISLGLFLIPINLIITYSVPALSSFFVIFGLIMIGAMYLIRLFRGFLVTYNYFSISIFHFFIYLCAFEILPLMFLYKFFINFL